MAPRLRPESFFRRLRAAAVLPWIRVFVVRGMARLAFFLRVSTLRRLRVLLIAFTKKGVGACSRDGLQSAKRLL